MRFSESWNLELCDAPRMRALLALLAFTTVAHAEPDPAPEPKSAEAATWWSIGVTTGGVAALVGMAASHDKGQQAALMSMGGLSLLVGPSIGHIYAHDPWTAGLALRGAGFTLAVLAESFAQIGVSGTGRCISDCHSNGPSTGALATAGVIALVGTLLDLGTTPEAVHRYNATLVVAPVQARDGVAPGLAFAGQF
jgi:hypothetical protein